MQHHFYRQLFLIVTALALVLLFAYLLFAPGSRPEPIANYKNSRFRYSFHIPPGYSLAVDLMETENRRFVNPVTPFNPKDAYDVIVVRDDPSGSTIHIGPTSTAIEELRRLATELPHLDILSTIEELTVDSNDVALRVIDYDETGKMVSVAYYVSYHGVAVTNYGAPVRAIRISADDYDGPIDNLALIQILTSFQYYE